MYVAYFCEPSQMGKCKTASIHLHLFQGQRAAKACLGVIRQEGQVTLYRAAGLSQGHTKTNNHLSCSQFKSLYQAFDQGRKQWLKEKMYTREYADSTMKSS